MTASHPRRRFDPPPSIETASPIELRPRGDFVEWLAGAGTLAVTTYNAGKLALISAPDRHLVASFWKFPRPMGLAFDGCRLAVASRRHISVLRLAGESWTASVAGGKEPSCLEVETVFSTGRLDAHDLAFDRRGLLLANTRFNCVARPSERLNFRRRWRPPFVPDVASTDCCHLNGVGVRDGRLAMVTAFCESSQPAAWREVDRFASGVLIDVPQNRVVARGLCLPHSPRWHEGRWWLCNSGEGTLAAFDPQRGRCDAVIALPGFTRGLTFAADRAVIGLSRIRRRHILDAPPVRQRFPRMRSGASLVDPRTGRETGSLEFIRGGREVFDVAVLPGACADDGVVKQANSN